ncbi:MAG: substrate-binding domain-containing protein [Anaerolineae bacterium]
MMILTVTVGCSNQFLTATPPPPAVTVLSIYSTYDTRSLIAHLATQQYEQDHNVRFVLESNNHQTLLDQLNTERIDYFLSHHNPADDPSEQWSAPLVQDGLAFVTHPGNPVQTLSIDELRRIYRGFITSWSELGGEDANIVLYSREAGAGIRLEFERLVMGQQRTSPNAQVLSSSQLIAQQVADDPHAIGYMPISLLNDQTQVLAIEGQLPSLARIEDNSYPLRTTIYVIGRTEPNRAYRQFFIEIQNASEQLLNEQYAPLPR